MSPEVSDGTSEGENQKEEASGHADFTGERPTALLQSSEGSGSEKRAAADFPGREPAVPPAAAGWRGAGHRAWEARARGRAELTLPGSGRGRAGVRSGCASRASRWALGGCKVGCAVPREGGGCRRGTANDRAEGRLAHPILEPLQHLFPKQTYSGARTERRGLLAPRPSRTLAPLLLPTGRAAWLRLPGQRLLVGRGVMAAAPPCCPAWEEECRARALGEVQRLLRKTQDSPSGQEGEWTVEPIIL
ncbi:uncharacterized protein LOC125085576 [Lutra lutra]|uniref:uncharacterized protein LOC125085576 n=1 Tax=Lutra lutra TaxID=9657 RepID=UPI001FD4D09A|nr:uncharacterized protein LOC125085576 [Lutra lutra]